MPFNSKKFSTYKWDETAPLLAYKLIIIKGDSGTGVSFLGKRLAAKGYHIFNENVLLDKSPGNLTLFRELSQCVANNLKTVYIGNGFENNSETKDLLKMGIDTITISFAKHPDVSIPVKEYTILG